MKQNRKAGVGKNFAPSPANGNGAEAGGFGQLAEGVGNVLEYLRSMSSASLFSSIPAHRVTFVA